MLEKKAINGKAIQLISGQRENKQGSQTQQKGFAWYIKLNVSYATTYILRSDSFKMLSSRSPLTNSQSKTSLLQTGRSHIDITVKLCVPLTCVPCLPMSHQTRRYKLCTLPYHPTLPRTVLKDLLEFATKKSHLIIHGQYYNQIDGVAMRVSIWPCLS